MAEPMRSDPKARADFILSALQALEAMVTDGWLTASYDPSMPLQGFKNVTSAIHWNRDAKSASQLEN